MYRSGSQSGTSSSAGLNESDIEVRVMIMSVYWNWDLARDGVIRFGAMLFATSYIYRHILWFNSTFLPQIPVGYILLVVLGLFVCRHVYRTLRWYHIWLEHGEYHYRGSQQKYENLVIHACVYLVIASISLSIVNFI